MNDVASIARELTGPQRREVLRGSIGDAPMPLIRRLIGKGLMHIVPDSPNGRYGPCVLTPFGKQVAQHLRQTSREGSNV